MTGSSFSRSCGRTASRRARSRANSAESRAMPSSARCIASASRAAPRRPPPRCRASASRAPPRCSARRARWCAATPRSPTAGLRLRPGARAGADREHHSDRTALLAARAERREVPLADRRSGPARLLLLRWQDHHRHSLLRISRARRLSAAGGPARQASFALSECRTTPEPGGSGFLRSCAEECPPERNKLRRRQCPLFSDTCDSRPACRTARRMNSPRRARCGSDRRRGRD